MNRADVDFLLEPFLDPIAIDQDVDTDDEWHPHYAVASARPRQKEARRTVTQRVRSEFGHPPRVQVGDVFESRRALHNAGVHAGLRWGIHGSKFRGAYSIVMCGGYEDDRDSGDRILYVGTGGQDKPGEKRGPQKYDQSFEHCMNKALLKSVETRNPVRVVRGWELSSKYKPEKGYRYDGLYTVENAEMRPGRSGFQVCVFELRRIPGQPPIPIWGGDVPRARRELPAPARSAHVPRIPRDAQGHVQKTAHGAHGGDASRQNRPEHDTDKSADPTRVPMRLLKRIRTEHEARTQKPSNFARYPPGRHQSFVSGASSSPRTDAQPSATSTSTSSLRTPQSSGIARPPKPLPHGSPHPVSHGISPARFGGRKRLKLVRASASGSPARLLPRHKALTPTSPSPAKPIIPPDVAASDGEAPAEASTTTGGAAAPAAPKIEGDDGARSGSSSRQGSGARDDPISVEDIVPGSPLDPIVVDPPPVPGAAAKPEPRAQDVWDPLDMYRGLDAALRMGPSVDGLGC